MGLGEPEGVTMRLTIVLRLSVFLLGLCLAGTVSVTAQTGKPLEIYVVDVEGGNATLFVSPSGESVLIDTGNPGTRDAGRILDATKDAGVTQIDHLITTHWHGDHFGGLSEVASRIPIKQFIDHGGDVQHNPQVGEFLQNVYPTLYKDRVHTVAKPGDKIAVAGLDWRIVSAGGEVIKSALPGAGKANPN